MLFAATLALATAITMHPTAAWAPLLFPVIIVLALAFGVLLIIPIGGADMPTVIAILNSYAGLSAVAMGFVLDNKLLITAGALDGSSGLILSIIMCKAMNRSFTNVLFGAFGQVQQAKAGGEQKVYKSETAEGAAQVLEQASLVVIIPGYGMAVAQAQHKVRELYDQLKKRGITVKFAIHPVAGRMPGHMNVLLAEANIPYTDLVEMDDINHDMPQADVALVVGANDVVNPAARHDKTSPIYGMPIIEADKARTVFAIKRSKNPGFAGIDNELYFADRTWMLFGDAKAVVGDLVKEGGCLDVMNHPAADREGLHRHQVLEHAGRRVCRSAPARAVVDEERERADDLLLLVDDQRAARPDVLHVGEDLRVDLLRARQHAERQLRFALLGLRIGQLGPGIMRPPGGGLLTVW